MRPNLATDRLAGLGSRPGLALKTGPVGDSPPSRALSHHHGRLKQPKTVTSVGLVAAQTAARAAADTDALVRRTLNSPVLCLSGLDDTKVHSSEMHALRECEQGPLITPVHKLATAVRLLQCNSYRDFTWQLFAIPTCLRFAHTRPPACSTQCFAISFPEPVPAHSTSEVFGMRIKT